jgi:hypothetical protein
MPVVYVSRQLGHSSIALTVDLYGSRDSRSRRPGRRALLFVPSHHPLRGRQRRPRGISATL